MSIYATNFLVDEETGEVKLVKHLNKIRVDHWCLSWQPGGWNKSGRKSRGKCRWHNIETRNERRETKVRLRKAEVAETVGESL